MMSTQERQELIALVLKNFWGKAKLANGQYAEPASEEERTRGFSDKQVAFVSFLHGAAQGRMVRALGKGRACNDAERSKIERYLNESAQQGLDG